MSSQKASRRGAHPAEVLLHRYNMKANATEAKEGTDCTGGAR